jgi:nitronate monooxygenase
MKSWPDTRILNLLGIQLPIIQAPMARCVSTEMVIAVSNAGALGSLPCAALSGDQIRAAVATIRKQSSRPVSLSFFCHHISAPDHYRELLWRQRLAAYYTELGLDPQVPPVVSPLATFDGAKCDLIEELRPEVVSFHFGLPAPELLVRVKATGAKVLSSATTVDEAVWLQARGCDAIIAQGYEAGGHRGIFLDSAIYTQAGTMVLVPQVVDAVKLPVIAAGGISDARGIAAAFALGAAAVQLGTAYLFCPEATIDAAYRKALRNAKDDQTAITNVFTGRPARAIATRIVREVGPISDVAPEFPYAGGAIAQLQAEAEKQGLEDYRSVWCGQAARLGREAPAGQLTTQLAAEALERLLWLFPAAKKQ